MTRPLILLHSAANTSSSGDRLVSLFKKKKKKKTYLPYFRIDLLSFLFFGLLVYPITLEGSRSTTNDFETTLFHLVLFSAALVELAKSIPVHFLILSSYLFFCLPLVLFPFTVPSRIVFAKPEDLETWPYYLSFRF